MLYYGIDGQVDLVGARKYYQDLVKDDKLTQIDQSILKCRLAHMKLYGLGGAVDFTNIRKTFEQHADNKHLNSIQRSSVKFDLAYTLFTGIGGKSDYSYTKQLYLELSENQLLSQEKRTQSTEWLMHLITIGPERFRDNAGLRQEWEHLIHQPELPISEQAESTLQLADLCDSQLSVEGNDDRVITLYQELSEEDRLKAKYRNACTRIR